MRNELNQIKESLLHEVSAHFAQEFGRDAQVRRDVFQGNKLFQCGILFLEPKVSFLSCLGEILDDPVLVGNQGILKNDPEVLLKRRNLHKQAVKVSSGDHENFAVNKGFDTEHGSRAVVEALKIASPPARSGELNDVIGARGVCVIEHEASGGYMNKMQTNLTAAGYQMVLPDQLRNKIGADNPPFVLRETDMSADAVDETVGNHSTNIARKIPFKEN